ncbi:MAG TPA: hypothetical protein VNQ90_19010 [Chthoniobacteraceae bacterium]|nr:hypothetical protein [Chthoniobacteraceae bacterium]
MNGNRRLTLGRGAAVAALVCLFCGLLNREVFFRSWFYGFMLWYSVSLGALAGLMTHHLSGGRWGFVTRRLMEAALTPLPMLAVAFFVFFFGTSLLREGTGYFHPVAVALRAVICFGVWIGLSAALRRRSLLQDGTGDETPTREMRAISGPGLVVYFLTVSLAMTDWVMALEPGWRSTMFPGIMIATQVLMSLSAATAGAVWLLPEGAEVERLRTAQTWMDLGKLLFAFVIFWAYVAFAQLLIVWSGNLPDESVWYLARSRGGWEWLARGVGAAAFFAPAGVLLFQAPKRNRFVLAKVAVGIWVAQAIYLFWVVMPAFYPRFHVSWMDGVVPAAIGLFWSLCFWMGWSRAPRIARNDPRIQRLGVLTS